MKFATVVAVDGGGGPDAVDSLMSCWGNGGGDQHYAVVDSSGEVALSSSSDELKLLDPVVVDSANKATMDVLDSLLSAPVGQNNGGNGSFAELKPLPPFITSYTGQVRLNDIRLNEFYSPSQQIPSPGGGVGSSVQTRGNGGLLEANNNNSNVTNNNNLNNNNNNNVYKNCSVSTSAGELYYMSEPVTSTVDGLVTKPEDVLIGSIENEMDDFAAIIGNVMADTTVHTAGLEVVDARDAWMDFDLIDTDCTSATKTISVADAEYLHEMANHFADCSPSPPQQQAPPTTSSQNLASLNSSSTLQSLLTQGTTAQQHYQGQMIKREPAATYHHMPLLQSRLQNGGSPQQNGSIVPKQENTPYTQYSACGTLSKDMLPHTTLGSPPGHVTTSEITTAINGGGGGGNSGRFGQNGRKNNNQYSRPRDINGSCSSLDGFPTPKSKSKSRSNKNKISGGSNANSNTNNNSISTYPDGSTKEKPVHHCTICNRGFLNKSNIKVHLRTHTGEKPFRCEVCGKAFRQKAHLIKHQQIHKRVGRD